jgi:hypothetical protein
MSALAVSGDSKEGHALNLNLNLNLKLYRWNTEMESSLRFRDCGDARAKSTIGLKTNP